jgi:hypothetical protein
VQAFSEKWLESPAHLTRYIAYYLYNIKLLRFSEENLYKNGDFSLNYFPGYFLPFSKFQAHFSANGLLRETEMMDD